MNTFIFAACAIACGASTSALGAVVEYTVDSAASSLTLSGTFQDVSVSAQTPGSLTARYIGIIRGDLTNGALSLQDHSIRALFQSSPQNPIPNIGGSGDTVYGFRATTQTTGEMLFSIDTLSLYLSTSFRPPLDVADGLFEPDEIGFFMEGGNLFYTAIEFPVGLANLHGIGGGNQSELPGLFENHGSVETLTIPIVSSTVVLDVLAPGDLHLTFAGNIVATRVVPEPATTLLLLAGVGVWVCNRYRPIRASGRTQPPKLLVGHRTAASFGGLLSLKAFRPWLCHIWKSSVYRTRRFF